jgi:tRNA threonylcarbamoyladenosine modification (KEOPS) complex  Pcc1 subunit
MFKSVLIIELDNIRVARAINDSLSPDNINLPRGMKIKQYCNRNRIRINVEVSSCDQLNSLISTLDEIISHADLAAKVLLR